MLNIGRLVKSKIYPDSWFMWTRSTTFTKHRLYDGRVEYLTGVLCRVFRTDSILHTLYTKREERHGIAPTTCLR